jgi:methylase of polypeptide subunit release factors
MGGLTPCPEVINELLDPEKHTNPNSPPSILDLGCGSGIWAVEMVRNVYNSTYNMF